MARAIDCFSGGGCRDESATASDIFSSVSEKESIEKERGKVWDEHIY